MTSFRIVILFILLPSVGLLAQETYDLNNNSLRFGLGSAIIEDKIDGTYLQNSVFYAGYQFRTLSGRLRIIPAFDLTFGQENLDIFTDRHYFGTAFSTSIDYDLIKINNSFIFFGLGTGLRIDNQLIKVCASRDNCDYNRELRRSGAFFNMDLGLRIERVGKRSSFEVLGKVLVGEYETMVQCIFLIDIKV